MSGRGGSWDPVARVRSASAGVVDSGRRSEVAGGRTSPGEILAPVFTGAGDGGARGCRDLSWKRRSGGVLTPLPAALVPGGNLRSFGSGDGGVPASSFLGASSRSGLRLGDQWLVMAGLSRPGASTSVWQR